MTPDTSCANSVGSRSAQPAQPCSLGSSLKRTAKQICSWLVVWNMNFIFHNIWDVILPIDELIFFKMVIAPPTRQHDELRTGKHGRSRAGTCSKDAKTPRGETSVSERISGLQGWHWTCWKKLDKRQAASNRGARQVGKGQVGT